ncbi:MAG: LLM class flavin-dependent oxidoreductase [Candidatus Ranarchaeia archaeon]|jgi:5,10-methylenetetrahydromethanopterin reductase
MYRLDLGLMGDYPQTTNIMLAKLGEEYGFKSVWCAEENPAPGFNYVFSTATAVGLNTSKLDVVLGNLNPYSRHIGLIAVGLNSIAQLTHGRTKATIAAGGVNPLMPLGIEWNKPLKAMRDSFQILRELFSGKTVNYDGLLGKLKGVYLKPTPPKKIPLLLGARGPKMLELAGEIADGVNVGNSVSKIPQELEIVKRGLKKSQRDLKDFEVVMAFRGIIAEDGDKARELATPSIAYRLLQMETGTWHKQTFNIDEIDRINRGEIPRQKDFYDSITEEHYKEFGIIGSPEEVTERLLHMYDLGVDRFIWGFARYPQPEKAMHLLGKHVLPNLPKSE